MEEIWKDIKGYEGMYQISNLGRVRSLDRVVKLKNGKSQRCKGKEMKLFDNGNGYQYVTLRNGNAKNKYVHRLVAETFIHNNDPENKTEVNHDDNDKSNNKVGNLEWVTSKQNSEHIVKHGRQARGTGHGKAKLNEEDIRNIRYLTSQGLTLETIAKKYNISFQHVSDIKNNKRWNHVS